MITPWSPQYVDEQLDLLIGQIEAMDHPHPHRNEDYMTADERLQQINPSPLQRLAWRIRQWYRALAWPVPECTLTEREWRDWREEEFH